MTNPGKVRAANSGSEREGEGGDTLGFGAPPDDSSRVETQSDPERDEYGDGDGGEKVPGELVVASVDTPEVLDAAESVFDEMAVSIAPFVIDDLSLAADAARNDRNDAVAAQVCPNGIGVIALVSQQVARALDPVEQGCCCGAVGNVASAQFEGEGPAYGVGERVDLGGLAAARRTNRLTPRPPFPPWAERCALI